MHGDLQQCIPRDIGLTGRWPKFCVPCVLLHVRLTRHFTCSPDHEHVTMTTGIANPQCQGCVVICVPLSRRVHSPKSPSHVPIEVHVYIESHACTSVQMTTRAPIGLLLIMMYLRVAWESNRGLGLPRTTQHGTRHSNNKITTSGRTKQPTNNTETCTPSLKRNQNTTQKFVYKERGINMATPPSPLLPFLGKAPKPQGSGVPTI